MNRSIPSFIIVAVVLLASTTLVMAASQAEPPNYHISTVVPLGRPDHWDYVVFDPDTRKVYVAHGDRVTVVDGTNGAVVGTVEGMPGGTCLAGSPAILKHYTEHFVSDGGSIGRRGGWRFLQLRKEQIGRNMETGAYPRFARGFTSFVGLLQSNVDDKVG